MKNWLTITGVITTLAIGLSVKGYAQENPALASGQQVVTQQSLDRIPYQAIGIYVSQPQENLTHFAVRLWPAMREFTNKYGYEICGYFAFNPDKQVYEIILGTNFSQVRCLLYTDKIPSHTRNMLVSYHSHVAKSQLRLARVDRQIMAITNPHWIGGDGMDETGANGSNRVVSNSDNQNFSALDYTSGQGYLATATTLKYQHGAGSSQTMAIFQGFKR